MDITNTGESSSGMHVSYRNFENYRNNPYIKVTHDIIAQRLSLLCKKTCTCPFRLNPSLKRNSHGRYFIELKCHSTVLSTAFFIYHVAHIPQFKTYSSKTLLIAT